MQVIKFSKDYPKLEDNVFTTIRRYDRYQIDDKVIIETPTKEFEAIIIHKFKETLGLLGLEFLLYDTGTNTFSEALKVLNSFYRKAIKTDEKVTILIIRKLQGSSSLNQKVNNNGP